MRASLAMGAGAASQPNRQPHRRQRLLVVGEGEHAPGDEDVTARRGEGVDDVLVEHDDLPRPVVVAEPLVEAAVGAEARVLDRFDGRSMQRWTYQRPFTVVDIPDAHIVVLGEYVTTEDEWRHPVVREVIAEIQSATATSYTDTGLVGNTPAFAPEHLVRAGFIYDDQRLNAALTATFVDEQYWQDSNRAAGAGDALVAAEVPSYQVVDLSPVVLAKAVDVRDVGPAEAIDVLVVVPHRQQGELSAGRAGQHYPPPRQAAHLPSDPKACS